MNSTNMTDGIVARLFTLPLQTDAIIAAIAAGGFWVWYWFIKDGILGGAKRAFSQGAKSVERGFSNLVQTETNALAENGGVMTASIFAKSAGVSFLETITTPARFVTSVAGIDIGHAAEWVGYH